MTCEPGLATEIPGSDVSCETLNVRSCLTVNGVEITGAASGTPGWFGNGQDGALNFDGVSNVVLGADGAVLAPVAGVYTLTRCIYATDLTVAVGATIRTARMRVFASGVATINGLIEQNGMRGTDGGNAIGGTGGAGGGGATAGVFLNGGSGGAGSMGAGVAGGQVSNVNKPLGMGTAAIAANAVGGRMQGGGGGSAGASAGGTTPGNTGYDAAADSSFCNIMQAITGRNMSNVQIQLTSGGGGGAGGVAPAASTGGGGGGGGGCVLVAAREIAGSGFISAAGGAGGNATFAGGAAAGGGGGGGGGVVIVVTTSDFSTMTVTRNVQGGAGGTGISGGNQGGAGGAGFVYEFRTA